MLKVECSNCNSWFHLPFNSESDEVECPNCGKTTPAKDVYVSAGPYMIFRDVLIKNMPKYRRLILEAEKEITDLQKKAEMKTYDISAKSVNAFIASLKEMLDGCRDTVRYRFPGTTVGFKLNDTAGEGNLVNISVTGMCLDSRNAVAPSMLWSDIEVTLTHTHGGGAFTVPGKIVWIGKEGLMGVKFSESGYDAAMIRAYILEKSGLKKK